MFEPKIKIKKDLFEKLKVVAEVMGCTVEDFAEKVLSTEAEKVLGSSGKKDLSAADVEDITNKLKGLGYLE